MLCFSPISDNPICSGVEFVTGDILSLSADIDNVCSVNANIVNERSLNSAIDSASNSDQAIIIDRQIESDIETTTPLIVGLDVSRSTETVISGICGSEYSLDKQCFLNSDIGSESFIDGHILADRKLESQIATDSVNDISLWVTRSVNAEFGQIANIDIGTIDYFRGMSADISCNSNVGTEIEVAREMAFDCVTVSGLYAEIIGSDDLRKHYVFRASPLCSSIYLVSELSQVCAIALQSAITENIYLESHIPAEVRIDSAITGQVMISSAIKEK